MTRVLVAADIARYLTVQHVISKLNRDDWNGLIVLDKPQGITSRDAINRLQQVLPRRTKIGHTGTLDPLATGVLVVCLGHATRLAEYVQAMPKVYRSTFLLGATSDTDDADGVVTTRPDVTSISRSKVETSIGQFVGELQQVPPAYSAAKIDGNRAYDLARKGADVDLKPRTITVYGIDILRYEWPNLDVEIRCGKGTYIRSIARDLGEMLGCGGLVEKLRRTAVGPFVVEQTISPESSLEVMRDRLRPLTEAVAELRRIDISLADAERMQHGQAISATSEPGEVAVFSGEKLIAVAQSDGRLLQPTKVIPK